MPWLGLSSWFDASAWAASLNIGGVIGWRLPDTMQPDPTCSNQDGNTSTGFFCTGSEMGNLFTNVLGGVAGTSIATTHNANYDLFSNVQPTNSKSYWSATSAPVSALSALDFSFNGGFQGGCDKAACYQLVWAVHSGDVGAVPVPATIWLFGSGLLGLIGFARRKA